MAAVQSEIEQNRPQTIDICYGVSFPADPLTCSGAMLPRGSENGGSVRQMAGWLEPFCQSEIADQWFAAAIQ